MAKSHSDVAAVGDDIDGFFTTARVSAVDAAVTMSTSNYREYLYDRQDPAIAQFRGMDYERFAAEKRRPEFVQGLLAYWDGLYREPFTGITADGAVVPGLYRLPDTAGSNDAGMVAAAEVFLSRLSAQERETIQYPLDARQWRAWSNPEFVIHHVGLRLEDLRDDQVDAALGLIRASLSAPGYERVRETMALNGFLGELTELLTILNDRSYWIALYGMPSTRGPWGWQLFGHHIALNVVLVAGRQVIAPVFLGAEPADTDGARPPLFDLRERLAVELGESLTDAQREKAVVYDSVLDPAMPEGRLHPADERHVAGAFRDNRVIPYEGLNVAELDVGQRRLLSAIVEDFLLLLPDAERTLTLREVGEQVASTWVSWYGATDGSQPFYLRIHSPVILAEVDHHAGVWLSNELPERFHVHTTLRHPNGNDYARAYLDQWYAREGEQSQ
jgi:hypothetical protein